MEWVLFILFGAVAVCGAIMVVTRRHPMASALYLILTLFAVAALFVLRQAHFLAAIQVIVYAGAVIVLFLFALMLVGERREAESGSRLASLVGGILAAVLLGAAAYSKPTNLGLALPLLLSPLVAGGVAWPRRAGEAMRRGATGRSSTSRPSRNRIAIFS